MYKNPNDFNIVLESQAEIEKILHDKEAFLLQIVCIRGLGRKNIFLSCYHRYPQPTKSYKIAGLIIVASHGRLRPAPVGESDTPCPITYIHRQIIKNLLRDNILKIVFPVFP